MYYGYVKTGQTSADRANQIAGLMQKGVSEENLFIDEKDSDAAYQRFLETAHRGDVLVTESVNRLAKNSYELQDVAEDLAFQGVTLITLRESIDTSTQEGKLKILLSDHFVHI